MYGRVCEFSCFTICVFFLFCLCRSVSFLSSVCIIFVSVSLPVVRLRPFPLSFVYTSSCLFSLWPCSRNFHLIFFFFVTFLFPLLISISRCGHTEVRVGNCGLPYTCSTTHHSHTCPRVCITCIYLNHPRNTHTKKLVYLFSQLSHKSTPVPLLLTCTHYLLWSSLPSIPTNLSIYVITYPS